VSKVHTNYINHTKRNMQNFNMAINNYDALIIIDALKCLDDELTIKLHEVPNLKKSILDEVHMLQRDLKDFIHKNNIQTKA